MSAADELNDFYVHSVTVETKQGIYDTYGTPVTISCFVDETTRLVRSPNGNEVVSSTTITAHPDLATVLVQGARVTLPSGDVTTILTRSLAESGDLDLPDHVTAACE